MMSRHGKPDSRAYNVIQWCMSHVALTIGLAVIASLAATLLNQHFFAKDAAAVNDRSVTDHREAADRNSAPARTFLAKTPAPWASWVSNSTIDIAPGAITGIGETGFPRRGAIPVDMPFTHHLQTSQVASTLAFDLTGLRSVGAHVTSIKAVVDSRAPTPTGTVYYAVPQGATGREDFAIDFGSDDLNARIQDDEGAPTPVHYLNKRLVTVTKGETVGFNAVVVAPFYGEEIRYHLEVAFDDGSFVEIRNNDGSPFRIVSYPQQAERGYVTANAGSDNWGIFPCDWPRQCQANALRNWPFEH